MQERNWGRIGLPRLADQADVNPAWYLRFRCPIGSAAVSFHQFLDAERQTYPHASPTVRLLVSRARVLSVSPGYQARFRLEWLPFSLQIYFLLIFNTICDMAISLEMHSIQCNHTNNFFIAIQRGNISTSFTSIFLRIMSKYLWFSN